MIQRVVLVKLKEAYRNEKARDKIAQETRAALIEAHGVVGLEVGVPGDNRTRREWDLCILVRFETRADVEAYGSDRIHRAYADVFLEPLRESIRVWNFDVGDGS